MCQKAKNESGMTLVELVVTMVLVTIISGFVANIIFYEINTYELVTYRKEGMQNTRFAMQLMGQQLRQIAASDSILQATQDSVRFADIGGASISFRHENYQLFRNSDLLLDDVSDFSFSYFDNNGDVLSFPITDFTQIRSLSFAVTTTVNGQPVSTEVSVTPRNF